MTVCDVCMRPEPVYGGSPYLRKSGTAEVYLFGQKSPGNRIDLCEECKKLFEERAWDKIAEKAHDVLMLRLGVPCAD